MIAIYALSHIILANLANARIQGAHRHSFWAEVYETVLAWYITMPTTMALLKPSAGKFNVTAKGGLIQKTYFDWTISKPYIFLIAANFIGLFLGVVRMLYLNTYEITTVLLNMIWAFYNFLMLGVAVGVATETRQVRASHRVSSRLPAALRLTLGVVLPCSTLDYSLSGLGLEVQTERKLTPGQRLQVALWHGETEHWFPVRVVAQRPGILDLRFDELTMQQEADLVQCTFARADAWTAWKDEQDTDRPLQGLHEIFSLGLIGYKKLYGMFTASIRSWKHGLSAPQKKQSN
jgi:cellulose synthase (UDP-forming)